MSPSMADKTTNTFLLYCTLSWRMTTMNILSAMEYRVTFFLQVIGMFINDIALILIWVIFFAQFPMINGWTLQDSILLMSMVTFIFGIVHVFSGGSRELAKTITQGELDYYLTYPKNVLWHVSISRTDISALGDMLFGLVLFCFSGNISLEKIFLFLTISLFVAFILFNFLTITQSLSFFFGNFEDAAEALYQSMMGFSLYPQTSFYGFLKVIMMTVLPAFFIVTIPVNIIKTFDLLSFLLLLGFALVTFLLAVLVFYKGLQKYESGNLINLKM